MKTAVSRAKAYLKVRQKTVRDGMKELGLDGLLLTHPPDLAYLTNFTFGGETGGSIRNPSSVNGLAGLRIGSGARVTLLPGGDKTIFCTDFTIAPTGVLELNDGDLVVQIQTGRILGLPEKPGERRVRELADEIIASQVREIAEMKAVGVTPVVSRNAVVKLPAFWKPTSCAISRTSSAVSRSSAVARSRRSARTWPNTLTPSRSRKIWLNRSR